MIITQFSICRIGEGYLASLLDFLFHRIRANENIDMHDDGKFHELSEYTISFKKRLFYGKDFLKIRFSVSHDQGDIYIEHVT